MALGDVAAKLGVPVFPCDAEKKPIVAGGFKAATRDAATILRAFATSSAQMIGMPTGRVSGVIVIDVDVKNGAKGREWLAGHEDALPPTRTHKTRSGGLHLLFTVPAEVEIRNSTARVGPGVDVRGEGGYIIVPPSPGYEIADDTPPAEMPRWLISACQRPAPLSDEPAPRPPSRHEDSANGSPYGLAALESECATIAGAAPGTQEPALNDGALRMGSLVAAGLLDRSYAAQRLIAAGMQMRNGDAHHPWTRAEVTDKVDRGLADGARRPRQVKDRPDYQPRPRANGHAEPKQPWHKPHIAEEDYPEGYAAEAPPQQAPARHLPFTTFENLQARLDADDFVEGLLTRRAMSVVYGESNSGKTFFATDLSLHVAAGMAWRNREVDQGAVLYLALEGSHGIANRIAAFRTEHGLDDARIPFAVVSVSVNLLDAEAHTQPVIETVRAVVATFEMPVSLIVIDTLARAISGGNENAAEDMGALIRNGDEIRGETGAHIMWIHHSGKDQAKGARGHSSLRAATDTEIEVSAEGHARLARVTKQRDMECVGEFPFTLKVCELGMNRRGKAVTSCVVEAGDEHAAGAAPVRNRLTGDTQRALEILSDLVATSGRSGDAGVPPGVQAVPEKWWRERFYERAKPGAEQEAKKRAFRRAADYLVEHRRVGMGGGRVWCV